MLMQEWRSDINNGTAKDAEFHDANDAAGVGDARDCRLQPPEDLYSFERPLRSRSTHSISR